LGVLGSIGMAISIRMENSIGMTISPICMAIPIPIGIAIAIAILGRAIWMVVMVRHSGSSIVVLWRRGRMIWLLVLLHGSRAR